MKSVLFLILAATAFSLSARANHACKSAYEAVLDGEKFDLNWSFPDNRMIIERALADYQKKFDIVDENDVEIEVAVASYTGPSVAGYSLTVTGFGEKPLVYAFDANRNLLHIQSENESPPSEWICESNSR
jgi:hypothetical protein